MIGLEWMEGALCAQVGGDAWFPDPGKPAGPSKRVCRKCPVQAECLDYALAMGIKDGLWGGLAPKERQAIVRAARERDVAA